MSGRGRIFAADHFGGVLILLVAMILTTPLVSGHRGEGLVSGLLSGLLVVGALSASGIGRQVMIPAAIVVGVLVAVSSSAAVATDGTPPAWTTAIVAAMLACTPFLVLRRVLQQPVVTLSTVAGALCAYLLVGVTFSAVYRTLAGLDASNFSPELGSAATYFSFVTLTTTGFGDYVATSDLARSCVILEAVIGQVLLVTLVARFVSTLGQVRTPAPRRISPDVGEAPPPADA